jgi:hypothetical protein
MEPRSGRVLARQGFNTVPEDLLPFRLQIAARFVDFKLVDFPPQFYILSGVYRDNPGHPEDSKMEKTELVVNLLQADNLVVLG